MAWADLVDNTIIRIIVNSSLGHHNLSRDFRRESSSPTRVWGKTSVFLLRFWLVSHKHWSSISGWSCDILSLHIEIRPRISAHWNLTSIRVTWNETRKKFEMHLTHPVVFVTDRSNAVVLMLFLFVYGSVAPRYRMSSRLCLDWYIVFMFV